MNRVIPLLLLIVLLGILGGYLLMNRGENNPLTEWKVKEQKTVTVTYEEQNNQDLLDAEKDAEYYNSAVKEKRLDLCNPIKNQSKKNECRDIIAASDALQEKNPELCSVLTNSGIRERCLDNIAYFVATQAGEANLCETIQDETIRTQCVLSIDELNLESHMASGSLDVTICETLSNDSLKEDCKRKVVTEKDSEYYREALAETSITICNSIIDPVVETKCRDAVLYDLALKEGNLDYCSNITNTERSDYCRKSLLGRQDVSRYQQYVRSGNLESCNELTVIQMKNQCHDTIIFAKVRETRDEALCDLLYNTGITSQCREMLIEPK